MLPHRHGLRIRPLSRALLSLALLGLLLSAGCTSAHDEGAERVLGAQLQAAPSGKPLAATSLLPADGWDRLYVFTPYTSDEVEKAALGSAWRGEYSQESRDSTNVLVLTKDRAVVDWLDLPRSPGADLQCVKTPKDGFDRRAIFVRIAPSPSCPYAGTADVREP